MYDSKSFESFIYGWLVAGFFCFCLLRGEDVAAQQPDREYTNKHYTVHDGLAQMQVMSLYQDSKGYLWCHTKAGLSRFDGKNFRSFTEGTKLPGFDIVVMGETGAGHLLLFGRTGFSELRGDAVITHTYPENANSSSLLYHEVHQRLKEIHVRVSDSTFRQALMDYTHPDSLVIYDLDRSRGRVVFCEDNSRVWQATADSVFVSELKSQKLIDAWKSPGEIEEMIDMGGRMIAMMTDFSFYELDSGRFSFLLKLKTRSRFVKAIATPANDALIIKTDKELYHFRDELVLIKDNLTQVRDILFDKEENLWVATEEGLYNFFQLNFVNYTFGMGNKDWVWSVIEDNEHNFWFASYQNGLWKWDGTGITNYTRALDAKIGGHLKTREAPAQYRYYMGASKVDDVLYFPTECNVLKYQNGVFSPVENILELPYQITKPLPDGSVIFAGYAGLFQQKKDGTLNSWSRDSVGVSSILNVEMDGDGNLVAVGKEGVAVISEKGIRNFREPHNLYSYSTAKDHRNNIWIGGMKNLSLYDGDTVVPIAQKEGEAFYSLLFVGPHYLFLGGIKGLYLANLEHFYRTGNFETQLFGRSSGFTGIECGQNGFFTDSEGMVWIPTSDRVTRFDPQKLIEKKIAPPRIYLNAEVSSDIIFWEKTGLHNQKFAFSNNNLRFRVDVISFASVGNIRMYYQLEGLQNEWSDATELTEMTFYDLKPGKYRFRVKADAGISSAMSEVESVEFEIDKPVIAKWWFIVLEILAVSGIVFGLIQYFRRQEQQKAVTRQRLTQLRSEALAAQLDPHFVMNCLNNISGLVNAGHKKAANQYIVRFSKLLRVILQSVKKEAISLNDELEMVEEFIRLEQFRCNNCFSYKVSAPKNYSTEKILVPPMLLQPLVENAVKHGFGNSEIENATIEITVEVKDKSLHFSVADNGKGLNGTPAEKGTGLGTKITRERIELLQKKNNIEFEINGRDPGVEVKFKIPLVLAKGS